MTNKKSGYKVIIFMLALTWALAKSFVVATAVCGVDYIPAGKKLLQSIRPHHAIVFYDSDEVATALSSPNVSLRRFLKSTSSQRFKCSEAKVSLYHVKHDVLWIDLDTVVIPPLNVDVSMGQAWAAAAQESIDSYRSNWYRCCSSIGNRFVQPNGINSGIMYFNTTAWRLAPAISRSLQVKATDLPDQNCFNEYFYAHPRELAILPMKYNYRGRAISGDINAVIHHSPGTQCAKSNSCTVHR